MSLLDLHHQLQVGPIPHLDAAIIADAVQEVLVPQDGCHSVLVGFLPDACLRQLALLANVPGPTSAWNRLVRLQRLSKQDPDCCLDAE